MAGSEMQLHRLIREIAQPELCGPEQGLPVQNRAVGHGRRSRALAYCCFELLVARAAYDGCPKLSNRTVALAGRDQGHRPL